MGRICFFLSLILIVVVGGVFAGLFGRNVEKPVPPSLKKAESGRERDISRAAYLEMLKAREKSLKRKSAQK